MRRYVKVVVTRTAKNKWYKVGQELKVAYAPSKDACVTEYGQVVEVLDIRSK